MFRDLTYLSSNTSDYAVVIVGGVFVFAAGWWIISARKWFHGPVVTIELPKSDMEAALEEKN